MASMNEIIAALMMPDNAAITAATEQVGKRFCPAFFGDSISKYGLKYSTCYPLCLTYFGPVSIGSSLHRICLSLHTTVSTIYAILAIHLSDTISDFHCNYIIEFPVHTARREDEGGRGRRRVGALRRHDIGEICCTMLPACIHG